MIMNIAPENMFTYGQCIAISKAKMGLQALIDRYDLFNNLVTAAHPNPNIYAEDNCIFAGGYFASHILNSALNDIDLFVLNNNDQYFSDLVSIKNDRRPGKPLSPTVFGMPRFEDEDWIYNDNIRNGNYLNNSKVWRTAFNKHTKVQYILSSHKTRQELLDDFDMVHCTVSYVHGTVQKLYITKRAYDAIARKAIAPNNWKMYAATPVSRLDKLRNRGWLVDEVAVKEAQEKAGIASVSFQQNTISRPKPFTTAALPPTDDKMIEKALDLLLGNVDKDEVNPPSGWTESPVNKIAWDGTTWASWTTAPWDTQTK